MPLLLGLDIGGTKCAAVVGTAQGDVVAREEWASQVLRGPEAMLLELEAAALRLIRKYPEIHAVGVSIGGPLDAGRGIIHSPPNLPGWDAVPLLERLEGRLGLPITVVHDAAACAFAEYLWGGGQCAQNLAYLTCGTGFGCGMVFGGRIHTGAGGSSCEVGHIRIRNEGPTAFGKQGCAEAYCSGTALTLLAQWRFPDRWGTSPPTAPDLAQLAATGDAAAREVLAINAAAVGDVCAILADTLGLDVILLGSLARYLGEPWVQAVRDSFFPQVLPSIAASCRIEAAGLGERLQDCSSLAAALS